MWVGDVGTTTTPASCKCPFDHGTSESESKVWENAVLACIIAKRTCAHVRSFIDYSAVCLLKAAFWRGGRRGEGRTKGVVLISTLIAFISYLWPLW